MGININHVTNTVDDGHNTLTLTANKYRLGSDTYNWVNLC